MSDQLAMSDQPAMSSGVSVSGVLVPVKAFDEAKTRLSSALDAQRRAHLATVLATNTVSAQAGLDVAVVCDDERVAKWATGLGVQVLHSDEPGLNSAVVAATLALRAQGWSRVAIVHTDLPLVRSLAPLLTSAGVVIVPDRHGLGTNVLVVPTDVGFRFAYGPGSYGAHVHEAHRLGLGLRIVADRDLGWDIDEPGDLTARALPDAIASVLT